MSAFLTALTSIGSQYGEAKDQARQEKLDIARKAQAMDVQQSYLDIARQAEARQAEAQKASEARGDLIKIGNRLWSVSKAKFVDPQQVNPTDSLKQFIATLPPEAQAGASARAKAALEADPNNPKSALEAVMSYANAQQAEMNRRQDAATRERERREDSVTALSNRRQDEQTRRLDRLTDRRDLMKFAKDLSGQKPSADEIRRADLATNVNENLDALEEIVKRRPELFGPMHGTLTMLRGKIGTSDEDISSLEQIRDNLGRALQGAHGMRSATGVLAAGNSVLNNFRNNDKAVLSAIRRARSSVQTFINDVDRKTGGGGTGATPSPDVNSNDPLGVLK